MIGELRPPQVGEGMLRVGILREIPPLLRELGQDYLRLLGHFDVPANFLDDPERVIPFQLGGALLADAVALTGCPHFGLLLGQRGGLDTLGVVGLLARHSLDVGSALRNLVKYLHFHDRGASPSLVVEDNLALLGYAIFAKDLAGSEQASATALSIACNIMRDLCGADWHPSEARLPFRKPANTTPYRAFFRAPLRFGAEQAALAFPAGWLERRVPNADPRVRRAVESVLTDLAANDGPSIGGHVRRAVLSMLVSGSVNHRQVAQAFAMHRRSLGRRLRQERTTFLNILKDVRFEVACQLLRDTDNTVEEIAVSLGYAGASPFVRAFRKLSGLTPVQWRNGHAHRPGIGHPANASPIPPA